MKVLVTGGAGYIGSTVCSALADAGHEPIILDSLVTGERRFTARLPFYQGDVADEALLARVFAEHPDLAGTIHLAARIVVPESVQAPALYYRENVVKSLALFDFLRRQGGQRVVFSSSASVYAPSPDLTVSERSPLAPASPYARSKAMTEQILEDLCAASDLQGVSLRYFNPIGADPQLRSGPYRAGATHVLARLVECSRSGEAFRLTGTDYPTRDGSGLRDYIHVWDLARAHVAALEHFEAALNSSRAQGLGDGRSLVINVGSGAGVTVQELLSAFMRVSDRALRVERAPRRPGDAAGASALTARAHELLGWFPASTLDEALGSALAWDEHWAALQAQAGSEVPAD